MNGAHLVLKEWSEDAAIKKVSFATSTFNFQIYGLPPRLLNEKNARHIGAMIGELQEIEGSLVITNCYLRVKVDIPIEEPILAGFIHRKERGTEIWNLFRVEK